jgi:hypothetical protein
MVAELEPLIDKVWRYCDEKGLRGRTVSRRLLADIERHGMRSAASFRLASTSHRAEWHGDVPRSTIGKSTRKVGEGASNTQAKPQD